MAQRTEKELKVFLNGTLTQYNALSAADKVGTVFFDRTNHALYAEGACVMKSAVENVTYNQSTTELVITAFGGTQTTINLGIQAELDNLKTTLETWAGNRFVRFDTKLEGTAVLSNDQKTNARANIDAEKADATILKQTNVVDNVTSTSTTAPLSANQGKVLKGLIDGLSSGKVDKVTGKQLSTEDFTTALKTKLESLNNYDDTELSGKITELTNRLNTLIGSEADTNKVIDTFNEIVAFLNGIEEGTLDSILSGISGKISALEGKDTAHEQRMTTIEGNVTSVTTKANNNASAIQDLDGRIDTLENTTKNGLVSSVNTLKGAVEITGKEYNLDDEGYHRAHPISVDVAGGKIVVDATPIDILALALKNIIDTSDPRVQLSGLTIQENATEDNYSIKVDAHARVWEF